MAIADFLLKPIVGASLVWVKAFVLMTIVVLYWVYDSTLLAGYGIGPEMNLRGVFESKLVNSWLVMYTINPLGALLLASCVLLLLLGLVADVVDKRRRKRASWAYLVKKTVVQSSMSRFDQVAYPIAGLLFVLLVILMSVAFLSTKASEQVRRQIERFIESGECTDLFSNDSIGCYTLPGQEGEGHLLIYKGKQALAYMTRPVKTGDQQIPPKVVVIYSDGRVVMRDYIKPGRKS